MRQKKLCAHNRMHAMRSPRKVKSILSSHKKGTAPEKTSKHLSDLTRMGLFLKNKLCHLTRKGPLLAKQTAVSSHKKGPLFKNKLLCHRTRKGLLLEQTKTPNKIVATDHKMRVDLWNLVTTCGMALRLEILIAGCSVSHQAWSCSALKGYSNIFLLPWRLDALCTMGDDPRQARSYSSEFCS